MLDRISRGWPAGLDPVGAEMDFGDECRTGTDFGEKVPWGYKSSCTLEITAITCAFLNNGAEVLMVIQVDRLSSTYYQCVDMGRLFWWG